MVVLNGESERQGRTARANGKGTRRVHMARVNGEDDNENSEGKGQEKRSPTVSRRTNQFISRDRTKSHTSLVS